MYANNNLNFGSSMPATNNDFDTSNEDLTVTDLDMIVLDDYTEFYKLMSNVSASALSVSSFQSNNYTGIKFKHLNIITINMVGLKYRFFRLNYVY